MKSGDFSILFKSLDVEKNKADYPYLEEAMQNTSSLQDPIDRLREIVMDSEKMKYTVLISC